MLSFKSFKTYIHRVLKSVNQEANITKNTVECIDSIIRTVGTRISDHACLFTRGTEKTTISVKELVSSTKVLFQPDVATEIITFSQNCVNKFEESFATKDEKDENTPESKTISKPVMRETRSGLIMSVSLAEKYLRGFGQVKYSVTASAPVFLAGVLQYVTEKFVKEAGNVCQLNEKTNITVRHLFIATSDNTVLNQIVKSCNIVILGGGVLPNINRKLLEKKKTTRKKKANTSTLDKKKANTSETSDKPRRWKPGTVALREIKKYQKTSKLLMQLAPFDRCVRELCQKLTSNQMRFTHRFMEAFQTFIETEIIKLLENANRLCFHANRETIHKTDVDLAVSLLQFPNSNSDLDTELVPTAAITKFSYRAGVKRMGDEAKTSVKRCLLNAISYYLRFVILSAEHNDRQTVNTKFLLEGLTLAGLNVTTVPEKRKNGVRKSGVTGGSVSSVENEKEKENGENVVVSKGGDDENDEEDENEEEEEILDDISEEESEEDDE